MPLIFHQQDTCEDRDKGPCKGCRAKGHKAKSKCQLAIQPKVNSDWELVIVRSLLNFSFQLSKSVSKSQQSLSVQL